MQHQGECGQEDIYVPLICLASGKACEDTETSMVIREWAV